jgi:hypothetical protein
MKIGWDDLEVGQKLWTLSKGSGQIIDILYADKEVVVTFWEKGTEVFEFDDLAGNWTTSYGGTWTLEHC